MDSPPPLFRSDLGAYANFLEKDTYVLCNVLFDNYLIFNLVYGEVVTICDFLNWVSRLLLVLGPMVARPGSLS